MSVFNIGILSIILVASTNNIRLAHLPNERIEGKRFPQSGNGEIYATQSQIENVGINRDATDYVVSHNFSTNTTNFEYFDYLSYPKRYTDDYYNEQSASRNSENNRNIIGEDERYCISNPKQSLYFPTCKMTMYRNGQNPDFGTGFLIGPNLLMTAGHCVYNSHHPVSAYPDSISVYFGLNGIAEYNLGSNYNYYAECQTAYTSYSYYLESSDNWYNDWAIIELDRNIGYTIGGYWYELTSNWYIENGSLSSWGYPLDKDKTLWRTDGHFTGIDNNCYWNDLDTAGGQSGSPYIITNEFGHNYVCGIHTFASTTHNGGTIINDFIYAFADSFSHYHNYLHMAAEIMPTDYGFADNYPTDNYTASTYRDHYLNNGFHFQTRRYRTGYIHNEYVVMSSIRRNINSAFIEYRFDNPVVAIQVEMAHWRPHDHELLTPSTGNLVIRYLPDPVYYDDFTTIRDFFFPFDNLTTDRTNPDLITQAIPYTTTFQFYTDNNMNNTNDSNRGRVCIGSLKIFTMEGF